jgi:hypothetical protein
MTAPPEHTWPDLAKDCVHLHLPQGETAISLRDILDRHGLTLADLEETLGDPGFGELLSAEFARAKALGPRAGYVYRNEERVDSLAEHLYERLRDPGTPIGDVVRGFVALARSVGWDEIPWQAKQGGVNMAVQINIPALGNPKLDHLRGDA